MRVSFQAMVAVLAIAFVSSSNVASAMQLLPESDSPTGQSSDDVMKGVSQWSIDNEHTSMVCAVSHYGLSFLYGRFNDCSGTVELNFEEPGSSKFRVEVNPSSIDTNDATRDLQLRGPEGLDAAQYDSITFESAVVEVENNQGATKTGRRFQVTGNLTLHGETRRIKIPVDLLGMGKGSDGNLRCGFMSRFVVSRSEFGIDAMPDTVGDSVAVTFCFQTVRKKTETEKAPDARPFRFGNEDQSGLKDEPSTERSELENLFSPRSSSDDEVAPGPPSSDESSDGEINR
jgi:polyisoprenoid-binding protein YceI